MCPPQLMQRLTSLKAECASRKKPGFSFFLCCQSCLPFHPLLTLSGIRPHSQKHCPSQVAQTHGRFGPCHSRPLCSVCIVLTGQEWALTAIQPAKGDRYETKQQSFPQHRWDKSLWESNTATAAATYTGEVGIEALQILQCCKTSEAAKVCLKPLFNVPARWDTARVCKEDGSKAIGRILRYPLFNKLSQSAWLYLMTHFWRDMVWWNAWRLLAVFLCPWMPFGCWMSGCWNLKGGF